MFGMGRQESVSKLDLTPLLTGLDVRSRDFK